MGRSTLNSRPQQHRETHTTMIRPPRRITWVVRTPFSTSRPVPCAVLSYPPAHLKTAPIGNRTRVVTWVILSPPNLLFHGLPVLKDQQFVRKHLFDGKTHQFPALVAYASSTSISTSTYSPLGPLSRVACRDGLKFGSRLEPSRRGANDGPPRTSWAEPRSLTPL